MDQRPKRLEPLTRTLILPETKGIQAENSLVSVLPVPNAEKGCCCDVSLFGECPPGGGNH